MKTTLVIMAAGIGSRFGGGIKQLAPVGLNLKGYKNLFYIYYGKSVVEVFAGLEAQKISISSITKKPKVDVINQILGINDYEFIKTTLVIMAAGIKQLAPVGLNGEIIMDYKRCSGSCKLSGSTWLEASGI